MLVICPYHPFTPFQFKPYNVLKNGKTKMNVNTHSTHRMEWIHFTVSLGSLDERLFATVSLVVDSVCLRFLFRLSERVAAAWHQCKERCKPHSPIRCVYVSSLQVTSVVSSSNGGRNEEKFSQENVETSILFLSCHTPYFRAVTCRNCNYVRTMRNDEQRNHEFVGITW